VCVWFVCVVCVCVYGLCVVCVCVCVWFVCGVCVCVSKIQRDLFVLQFPNGIF